MRDASVASKEVARTWLRIRVDSLGGQGTDLDPAADSPRGVQHPQQLAMQTVSNAGRLPCGDVLRPARIPAIYGRLGRVWAADHACCPSERAAHYPVRDPERPPRSCRRRRRLQQTGATPLPLAVSRNDREICRSGCWVPGAAVLLLMWRSSSPRRFGRFRDRGESSAESSGRHPLRVCPGLLILLCRTGA